MNKKKIAAKTRRKNNKRRAAYAVKQGFGAKTYVSRPSQITKRAPSKRLRKRRRKNLAKPTKGRFPNPTRSTQSRPLLFIITAQKGVGKKMHFDGTNFSERARVSTFPTMNAAETKAQGLLKQYPVLRSYRVMIEPNKHRPNF